MMRHAILSLLFCTIACVASVAQTRLDYFLMQAGRYRLDFRWSEAIALYNHCLEISPNSAEATYQLGKTYIYMRQDSIGLDMIHRAIALDNANPYYLETLATLLLKTGREDEALEVLERMASIQSKRTDVLSHLSSLYTKLGRTDDAIKTLDRWETLEGKSAPLTYDKFTLYIQKGDSVSAFSELEALCNEYPADQNYRIRLGYQYQLHGNMPRAMQIYDEVRKVDPTNMALQMTMLDYYKSSGQESLYLHKRDSIMLSPATDGQYRLSMMRTVIQEAGLDSAKIEQVCNYFEQIIALDTTSVDAYTLYAIFLEYNQMPAERMCDVMQRILKVQPDNEMATRWLIQHYASKQDYASLEEICRRGVNYHPEELTYAYFLALTLIERDSREESITTIKRGLSFLSNETSPTLVSNMYTFMGDVYYKMNMEAEAYEAYDSALVYNKDNILCLNNYAYYLSLHGKMLDKAEEMSYRTIRLEGDNKTYLDTYAWILFVQGKYDEAQRYINKVVVPDSTDQAILADEDTSPVVIEHAADIAWMNSDKQRAVRFWNLAVEKDPKAASAVLRKKQRKEKYFKK